MVDHLINDGWTRFDHDPALAEWVKAAHPVAVTRVADPQEREAWLECEGTWFIGVDTLPNDPSGALPGTGPLPSTGPLPGVAFGAMCALYGTLPLHPGQVSVMYPGYPRPRGGEGEAAFRYRLKREAAHVDGLLAIGDTRARMLKERHAYILGIPLNECGRDASPLVVWEGSHHIMRRAFAEVFADVPPKDWGDVDLTAIYQETRREVFDTCKRIELWAKPGEAYALHRLTVHGVASWAEGATAPQEGRMIAYFRPELSHADDSWITAP